MLHGVTRDLWQIVFDAQVPPPPRRRRPGARADTLVMLQSILLAGRFSGWPCVDCD